MIESTAISQPVIATRKAGVPQAIIVILVNMLPMMAIITLLPVVPALIENFKDVPNITTLAPMVLAAPGLCVALIAPFAGYLTDKFGRRKLLLLFAFLYGIGGVLPFFIHSFPLLLGGRLLLGIGEAFIITVGNTLLGDYFDQKQRTKWVIVQSITGTFLAALLLSFSGYLASHGWHYPFLVYSISFLIAIASFFFIFEPNVKKDNILNTSNLPGVKLPVGIIATLCVTTFIATIIYFAYTLHFSLVLDSIGIKDRIKVGNYSAIASFGAPVGALLYKLISKKTIYAQLAIMSSFYAVGFIATGFAPSTPLVIVAAFIAQMGVGLAIPVLVPWTLQRLPVEFRGRGIGFWTTAFFLGQFVSPLVVSGVRSLAGSLLSGFIALGVFCLVSAIINFIYSARKTNSE